MPEYIQVQGTFEGVTTETPPQSLSEDHAKTVGEFLARDATQGTFAPLAASYWKGKIGPVTNLAKVETDVRNGEVTFNLQLDSGLFPPELGGLQHLLGILSGDLFNLQVEGMTLKSFNVKKLEVPRSWESAIQKCFRENRAHTTKQIRSAFKLKDGEPLLAFSLKPRIGLTSAALKEITLGVLKEGFHIVEMDTRYLRLDAGTISELKQLGKDAINAGKHHVTRFSPNLSASAPLALEACEQFMQLPAPVIIKVDGGLDGISTTQAIRQKYFGDNTPIITCYPLMKRTLEQRIGQDTFLRSLIWSGSDIVYPGGAPNLGGALRIIDYSSATALAKSAARYLGFVREGQPMLTVAAGIYAGQLHAYYELLGPDVAYFLGGGVALHKAGPIEGAKLCVEVVKTAQALRTEAKKEYAEKLPDGLIKRVEEAYEAPQGSDPDVFRYIPPAQLSKVSGLSPWFLENT